jgi:hypothetical protein
MLVRECPSCNSNITYSNKDNFNSANKKGSLCKKCAEAEKHGRKTITDINTFFRLYSEERRSVEDIAKHFEVLPSTVKNYANHNKINRRDYDIIMEKEGKKRCHGCKSFYVFDDFHKNNNTRDGLVTKCKKCMCEKSNDYKDKNLERVLKSTKEYSKRMKEENPETFKKWRKTAKKNYLNSEIGKWDSKCRSILKRALSKMGLTKNDTTNKLLGYSPKQLLDYLKTFDLYYEGGYEVDHKVPISYFKLGTHPSIINSLCNLQLTTIKYNQNKSNKFADPITIDYYDNIKLHIKEECLNKLIVK